MADEIEDRFLVITPPSLTGMTPLAILQGYVSDSKNLNVQISKNAIVIKGKGVDFKCPIPKEDLPGLKAAFQGDVRIRTVDDTTAFLTVKGKKIGNGAPEFEYLISIHDARELMGLCKGVFLTKNRYEIAMPDNHVWELDIFTGRHSGIIIAEIELPDQKTKYMKPDWLGPEITDDKRLSNGSLARTETKEIMKWLEDYRPKVKGPPHPAP